MYEHNGLKPGAFDFSKDAAGFKARLWNRLGQSRPGATVEELDDDDLGLINAAGNAYLNRDESPQE